MKETDIIQDENSRIYDAIIVGAGAAGLYCAKILGEKGMKVLLLEQNDRPGKKILVSGGGRCNITNLEVSDRDYLSSNPHFSKSALKRFSSQTVLEEFQNAGLTFHEKKKGQMFCDQKSAGVLRVLEFWLNQHKVTLKTQTKVLDASIQDNKFLVACESGSEFQCRNLILSSGGLSFPALGVSDVGLRIAKNFGHKIIPVRPVLVPMLASADDSGFCVALTGVSVNEVSVTVNDHVIRDDLLFTHKGLSGPVILKASLYWKKGDELCINFLPDIKMANLLNSDSKKKFKNILTEVLPVRLIEKLMEQHPLDFLNQNGVLSQNQIMEVERNFQKFRFTPKSLDDFNKAEVMAGGIDVQDVSSKTMESRLVSGLYFIGEVLDVTGQLGGYNFQWAWASARACGEAIECI
jgi:predicted Rossmann fold flavoprotein